MQLNVKIAASLALGLLLTLATGCGSLSLLSDRHVHYHGSEQADKKIDTLGQRLDSAEKRLDALEKNR